jgi:phage gpG-like protein
MTNATFTFAGGREIELFRWAQNIDNARPAFEAIADHQQTIWKKQFAQEGGYTNRSRWSPLSPRYAAWKQRHYPGKPILQLTGALFNSLTRRPFGVEEITAHTMVIGTDVPYAKYHQVGGPPYLPARPIIGPPPKPDAKIFAKIMQSWIVRGNVNV